jgi:hypothetical protein
MTDVLEDMSGNTPDQQARIDPKPATLEDLMAVHAQARPMLDEWMANRVTGEEERKALECALPCLDRVQARVTALENPLECLAVSAGLATLMAELYALRNTAIMVCARITCVTDAEVAQDVLDILDAMCTAIQSRVEDASTDTEFCTKLGDKAAARIQRWRTNVEHCDNDREQAFKLTVREEHENNIKLRESTNPASEM